MDAKARGLGLYFRSGLFYQEGHAMHAHLIVAFVAHFDTQRSTFKKALCKIN